MRFLNRLRIFVTVIILIVFGIIMIKKNIEGNKIVTYTFWDKTFTVDSPARYREVNDSELLYDDSSLEITNDEGSTQFAFSVYKLNDEEGAQQETAKDLNELIYKDFEGSNLYAMKDRSSKKIGNTDVYGFESVMVKNPQQNIENDIYIYIYHFEKDGYIIGVQAFSAAISESKLAGEAEKLIGTVKLVK